MLAVLPLTFLTIKHQLNSEIQDLQRITNHFPVPALSILFQYLWVLLKYNTAKNINISILSKLVLSLYSKNRANPHCTNKFLLNLVHCWCRPQGKIYHVQTIIYMYIYM